MLPATAMLKIAQYSLGVGDRFAHQAQAQLRACQRAAERGVEVIPVWNKSNREHTIIGSEPASVRAAADAAVQALGGHGPTTWMPTTSGWTRWTASWPPRISSPLTWRISSASRPPRNRSSAFADRHPELAGRIEIAGIAEPFPGSRAEVERVAGKFLLAVQEAGKVYRHIAAAKGAGRFITGSLDGRNRHARRRRRNC